MLSADRLRASDMVAVAHSTRRLADVLAAPCTCRKGCTIGEHVWRSTRDGQPGLRAQTLDENRARTTGSRSPDLGRAPDRTARAHAELRERAARLHDDAEALAILVASWSPNRHRDDTTDDADWCRHHLDTMGACEPRYRGDLCRRCYDFTRAQNYRPPEPILQAWHRGERVTTKMIQSAKPKSRKRRRRRRAA